MTDGGKQSIPRESAKSAVSLVQGTRWQSANRLLGRGSRSEEITPVLQLGSICIQIDGSNATRKQVPVTAMMNTLQGPEDRGRKPCGEQA